MRYAAIDVGSNSTRLLVADLTTNAKVIPILTDLKTTRLGQGILRNRLMDDAMERTLAVIENFVQQAGRAGAEKIVLAATSAVRDAVNKEDFIAAILSATGLELCVLSGSSEARLSYLGVAGSFDNLQDALVIDIGGGSTEFIWRSEGVIQFISLNVGAVRMTESGYGEGQIRHAISGTLWDINRVGSKVVIGVGGTVTTLAAMAQGLSQYDPQKVHGFSLNVHKIDDLYEKMCDLPLGERKKLFGLQPERADIIPAGTRILSRILHGLNQNFVLVSETDILYGLVKEGENCRK